jgi:hypothetical protein
MTEISIGAFLVLTHFVAAFIGFACGGYVGYKLVLNRIESGVSEMFSFGDAGSLIDELTEVDEE